MEGLIKYLKEREHQKRARERGRGAVARCLIPSVRWKERGRQNHARVPRLAFAKLGLPGMFMLNILLILRTWLLTVQGVSSAQQAEGKVSPLLILAAMVNMLPFTNKLRSLSPTFSIDRQMEKLRSY